MLGDEGRNLPHLRADPAEGRDGFFVAQHFGLENFGGSSQRPAQTIQRQFAPGQSFAPRLKIAERVKDQLVMPDRFGLLSLPEERRLLRRVEVSALCQFNRRQ